MRQPNLKSQSTFDFNLISHDEFTIVVIHREFEAIGGCRQVIRDETVSLAERTDDHVAVIREGPGQSFRCEDVRGDALKMVQVGIQADLDRTEIVAQIVCINAADGDDSPIARSNQMVPQLQGSLERAKGHLFGANGIDNR